jgi:NADH-quinone oxidoreductase subunit C
MLADLTAIDREDSFEMVYHLMSLETADIVTVKVMLTKTAASIDSIVSIWAAANVQEREVFDMFGIQFNGHPNLTRILNPEDYTEFPLLKSFVLTSIDRQTLS